LPTPEASTWLMMLEQFPFRLNRRGIPESAWF
jgi:hypothetical protein